MLKVFFRQSVILRNKLDYKKKTSRQIYTYLSSNFLRGHVFEIRYLILLIILSNIALRRISNLKSVITITLRTLNPKGKYKINYFELSTGDVKVKPSTYVR